MKTTRKVAKKKATGKVALRLLCKKLDTLVLKRRKPIKIAKSVLAKRKEGVQ